MRSDDDSSPRREHAPHPGEQASSLRWRLTHLEVVDSTNRFAGDAAREGAEEGLVVVADEQTAGRGRRGRSWLAPRGGALLCSILFRPLLPRTSFHLLSTLVGLSALDAIEDVARLRAELKWPNDVELDELKLGGLLAEVVPAPEERDASVVFPALVVGLGLNVSFPKDWLPREEAETWSEVAAKATTLAQSGARAIAADTLLSSLLVALGRRYADLSAGGHAGVMEEYRSRCSTIGREVRVELRSESFDARAIGIADDGRLVVERRGEQLLLDVADVFHLRSRA